MKIISALLKESGEVPLPFCLEFHWILQLSNRFKRSDNLVLQIKPDHFLCVGGKGLIIATIAFGMETDCLDVRIAMYILWLHSLGVTTW